jgi:membrane protein DedA with SNARE-associated domain
MATASPVASQSVTEEPVVHHDVLDEGPESPPWWAPLTLIAFVSLVVCSYVGTAVSTKWVNTNPEALLMLSSRVRHLLGVAGGEIDFWSYFLIGGLRLALAFVVCHLIGRAYGRAVLIWFGKYLGVRAEQIHSIVDLFHRAEWFVVPFFAGSNIVAAISGIARVPPLRLTVLLTVGLVARLVLWWEVAVIADDEIDAVLDFLNTYQTPALIVSVVLTVAFVMFNLRRGRNFEL